MSFLSFKRSPSKKETQNAALVAERLQEEERQKLEREEEEKKRQKEQVLAAYKQGRPQEENPPRARLNPKLTQRGAPPDFADIPADDDKHKPKTATKLTHDGRSLPVVYFLLYLLYCLLIKCTH